MIRMATRELITLHDARMMAKSVGRFGANAQELKRLSPRLEDARDTILEQHREKSQGWMNLGSDTDLAKEIAKVVKKMSGFDTCLVLGIGGSDLGTRALYRALRPSKRTLVFAGANTDPDELAEIVSSLDLKTTCVNIVSKSGGTIEPITSFYYVYDLLQKAVGKTKAAKHVVATTDPESGELRSLAKKHGWATLPVPQNVGGRFSALTAVGLFPLAFAGASIEKLQKGAKKTAVGFKKDRVSQNAACRWSALQYLAYTKRKQHINVLMPYAAHLDLLGAWYRQLWAESLGKKENRMKKRVHIGPTPVAALGATDQHSQIQLYNEGPNDKTITFIEVSRFNSTLKVPKDIRENGKLAYLAGTSFEKIIHAEREATSRALAAAQRPNGTLEIPKISEETMGALILFFELATAMMGELFEIDTYNQPGVEAGKRAMKSLLS